MALLTDCPADCDADVSCPVHEALEAGTVRLTLLQPQPFVPAREQQRDEMRDGNSEQTGLTKDRPGWRDPGRKLVRGPGPTRIDVCLRFRLRERARHWPDCTGSDDAHPDWRLTIVLEARCLWRIGVHELA